MSTTVLPPSSIPLTPFEERARIHAHIAFFAFLFGLPIGAWVARWLRTYTRRCVFVSSFPFLPVSAERALMRGGLAGSSCTRL